MLTPDELLRLAEAYSAATGLGFSRISRLVARHNDKAFWRLSRGQSINTRTLLAAEEYFRSNWPENVPWPRDIPGRPKRTVAAVYSKRWKPSTESVID